MVIILVLGVVTGGIALGRHLATSSPSIIRGAAAHQKPTPVPGFAAPSSAPLPDVAIQDDSERFEAEFAALTADLNATVGVVVQALGIGSAPIAAGLWSAGPAWSTIKVPLRIAGLRASNPPTVTDSMRAAITQSDNAAAESIWQSLGEPPAAALKVQQVMSQYGDPTLVESQKVRPEFTAFGQTNWSLSNQAAFLSSAMCDPSNGPIATLMGEIQSDQSWGLGALQDAQFKGGWGPSETGSYLVRQMGVVPLQNGSAVVAMAAEPASGSFDDATQILTRIAAWLDEHADLLPVGHCP